MPNSVVGIVHEDVSARVKPSHVLEAEEEAETVHDAEIVPVLIADGERGAVERVVATAL